MAEAQMLHESCQSRISIMCFLSSLPRAKSTVISQKPHWFFSLLSTLQGQGRKPSSEWMVGGQGQLAAEGVAARALRAAALKMSSLVGRRRLSDMQCLILRWVTWALFDMENSRRSVHGTRLVKSVLGGTGCSLWGQDHYPFWNWHMLARLGWAPPSSGTNMLVSCCLLSDMVVVAESGKNKTNSKWQQDIEAVSDASVDTTQQHSETSCVLYPQPATNQCRIMEL